MSSVLSSLGGVAENSAGEALAFGLGFALGRALEPAGVELSQKAWSIDPLKALEAEIAAQLAAEGRTDDLATEAEAQLTGINEARFEALLFLAQRAPDVAQLLDLWRRGEIQETDVDAGLDKARLPPVWQTHVKTLKDARLDPAVIATAIQRGIMAAPFALPYDPNVAVGNVTPFAVSSLDTEAEAAAAGLDVERLRVETALVGLPMALDRAARARFRGILTQGDYLRAVLEGNARGEWAQAELDVAREILTSHTWVEARLRGWINDTEMYAGTALHGMSQADTDLLFKTTGRPIPVHQITTGEARGGSYNGDITAIPEAYLKSLEESNQRPEWYSLSYANRYTYPSAFVLRSLAQSGDLPPDEVEPTLLKIGWEPTFAKSVAAAWTGGTTAKADAHVAKAETQLWGALHKAYVDDLAADAETTADLAALGVAPAAQPEVLKLWNLERDVRRRALTPAQIKKTVGLKTWTDAERVARLTALGMSTEDIATFLAE